MSTKLSKRHFLLMFMGFSPNVQLILEVISDCEKMTVSVINEARNYALQVAKERGVYVVNMSLINSLELEERTEAKKGGYE